MFPAGSGVGAYGPDHLTFDLADASKLSLSFYGKRPGPGMKLDKQSLQFSLHEDSDVLEAYERLIHDAMMRRPHAVHHVGGHRAVVGAVDPAAGEPAPGPALRFRLLGAQRHPPADRSLRLAPPVRTGVAKHLSCPPPRRRATPTGRDA